MIPAMLIPLSEQRVALESMNVQVLIDEDQPVGDKEVSGLTRLVEHSVIAAFASGCRDRSAQCNRGEINIRICGDDAIQAINVEFLDHDYATDVISFPYRLEPPHVEGELVVSLPTASRVGPQHGWSAVEELLLYVIHGCLHLIGLDDQSDDDRKAMRAAEQAAFERLGVRPPMTEADVHHG